MTRVMIAIPSHDNVSMRFAADLAQLYALSSASLFGAVDLNTVIGTYVHDAREKLANDAIMSGASHVLWIDSDMTFPRDALLTLLRHNLPAVGINYSTRSIPGKFTATTAQTGERLITGPESTGLEEVAGFGFGLVLMTTEVLTAVPQPRFRFDWLPERGTWVGEDYSFCQRARESGTSLYVDHDLSKECSHIGAFEYRTEHAVPAMEYAS